MTSAKVIFRTQDRSSMVSSLSGIYSSIVVVSHKGPLTPVLITSATQLKEVFGIPDPKLGVSMYSALNYLSQGNKLWVSRAHSSDIKYSAALVRSKVLEVKPNPIDGINSEQLIVSPLLSGLTPEELASYTFPLYKTNKLYANTNVELFESNTLPSDTIRVDHFGELKVGDSVSFTNQELSELNSPTTTDGESEPTYSIQELLEQQVTYDNCIMETPVTASIGVEVLKVLPDSISTESYPGNPKLVRAADGTTNILVSNSDYIGHGDTVSIGGEQYSLVEKVLLTEDAKFLKLDGSAQVATTDKVLKVVQSEFEDRDCFLVTSSTPGPDGRHISVGIAPSRDYPEEAFLLLVYYKGVAVESWEVTMNPFIDGFGRQMQIDRKINGKSKYISIVLNHSNTNDEGVLKSPLVTDYSLWRQSPDDIFVPTGETLTENLLKGHKEVKLSGTTNITLGSRVKFIIGRNFQKSVEYKVAQIDSINNSIILDRPVEESQINAEWIDGTGTKHPAELYWFDSGNNSESLGVVDGVQYYSVSKLDRVFYNYPLNSLFIISGVEGRLLNSGANLLTGGTLGSPVSVGNLIQALNKFNNPEATKITMIQDGGWAYPAFAQAIYNIASIHGLTHGYLSTPLDAEESANYLAEIVEYKNSLNLNTELCSLFSGWVKYFDEDNQIEVWTSPDGYAAASQSYTTRNYNIFTPAAGWIRGKIVGLDVRVQFDEPERDHLVENRINPIRYKEGSGLVIWGNESLLSRPSPLQMRSVAFLIIAIKEGLQESLEYKTFEFNDEMTWSMTHGMINAFMRDEIKANRGVYNYNLAIEEVITPSDLDNRRMPIFLGIQPTSDIKEIPLTLAIFNNTVDIQVAL